VRELRTTDVGSSRIYSRVIDAALGLVVLSVVFCMVLYYWKGSLGVFFFNDDWVFFSRVAAADADGLARYIFKPHNIHFMPVFKALYYLEYRCFGLDERYYHVLSVFLLVMGAVLIYKFLVAESIDRLTAGFCAGMFAINSAYSHVVTWSYIQQMLISFVFMMGALYCVNLESAKNRPMVFTGALCLLSSFSLSMGSMSFFIAGVYYVLRRLWGRDGAARIKPLLKETLIAVSPLILFWIIYLTLFIVFSSRVIGMTGNRVEIIPVSVTIASIVGDLILKSAGIYLEDYSNAAGGRLPVRAALVFTSAAYVVMMSVIIVRAKRLKGYLPLFGLLLMFFFTVVTVVARANIGEPVELTERINRYKFFPFIGLIISIAPAISLIRERHKLIVTVSLLVAFTALSFVHHKRISTRLYSDLTGKTLVKMLANNISSGGTRYLEDFGSVGLGHLGSIDYRSLLEIVKGAGDRIVDFRGRLLLLKSHVVLQPDGWEPRGGRADATHAGVRMRAKADNTASVNYGNLDPKPFGHVFLRIKPEGRATGQFACYDVSGQKAETPFEMGKTFFQKEYYFPCPNAEKLSITLEQGGIEIEEARYYW
jgi:hypothetical protein